MGFASNDRKSQKAPRNSMTENSYAADELANSTSSGPSNDAIIISSSSEEDNSGSLVINQKSCKVNSDFFISMNTTKRNQHFHIVLRLYLLLLSF